MFHSKAPVLVLGALLLSRFRIDAGKEPTCLLFPREFLLQASAEDGTRWYKFGGTNRHMMICDT